MGVAESLLVDLGNSEPQPSPIFPWVFTRAGAKQGLREALSAFAQVEKAHIGFWTSWAYRIRQI